jgi:hypothetical protein
MTSSISFYSNQRSLRNLLRDFNAGSIIIPTHQRPYVWTSKQKEKFIRAILSNFPVSSILLRQLTMTCSLEDGSQRMRTAQKYVDGHFSVDGRLFADLTPVEQERFMAYQVPVEVYIDATSEQAIRIFIDRQGGSPLSVGNRLNALVELSQAVGFAVRMLLTPGQGFHDRAGRIWGTHNMLNDKPKQPYLMEMTALTMGLAFGPEHITKRWDAMVDNDILSRTFDDTVVQARLDRLLSIYERVQVRQPALAKDLKKQWPLNYLSGYIAYALHVFRDEEPGRIDDGFVEFMVAARRDPTLLVTRLHVGIGNRAWTLARWTNGYNGVFVPGAPPIVDEVDSDEDTD